MGQTREAYDRSKDALEASIATFERSFDAAGWGAAAFNHKIIDIARRNLNSGVDLATSLAGAKQPRRDRGIAGGLLAQAVRRIEGSSRGSLRAFDQGGGRCGRTAQGSFDEAWMSSRSERHCAAMKYATVLISGLAQFRSTAIDHSPLCQ